MESQLRGDLKEAILKRLDVEKRTLSLLINEIDIKKKDTKVEELPKEVINLIIIKELKKRNQSVEMFTKGNRLDLVEKENQEILVLNKYLPKAPTYSEILEQVKTEKEKDVNVHPGKLIGLVNKHFNGLANIEEIKKVIAELA